jgi:hypothetical protein
MFAFWHSAVWGITNLFWPQPRFTPDFQAWRFVPSMSETLQPRAAVVGYYPRMMIPGAWQYDADVVASGWLLPLPELGPLTNRGWPTEVWPTLRWWLDHLALAVAPHLLAPFALERAYPAGLPYPFLRLTEELGLYRRCRRADITTLDSTYIRRPERRLMHEEVPIPVDNH